MFQKKVKEPELIPLTAKDIKNLKSKLSEKDDLSELKIKDLDMSEIVPNSFKSGVIITVLDGKHCVHMPEGMDGPKYKTFRKSAGGRFSEDVLQWNRGNKHGKYVLIEGNNERKIARLIEDEELLLFQSLKLIKGIVKDKPFMLLKDLAPKEKLTNCKRYIKENSEHKEVVDEEIIPVQVKAEEGDEHKANTTSVSLFDE